MSDEMSTWTYNRYRATLMRDGKTFAIVTPDGRARLSEADEKTLIDTLNRAPPAPLTGQQIDDAIQGRPRAD